MGDRAGISRAATRGDQLILKNIPKSREDVGEGMFQTGTRRDGVRKFVELELEFRDESTLSVHILIDGIRIHGQERTLTLQREANRFVSASLRSGENFIANFGQQDAVRERWTRTISVLLQGAENQEAKRNPEQSRAGFQKLSGFLKKKRLERALGPDRT